MKTRKFISIFANWWKSQRKKDDFILLSQFYLLIFAVAGVFSIIFDINSRNFDAAAMIYKYALGIFILNAIILSAARVLVGKNIDSNILKKDND